MEIEVKSDDGYQRIRAALETIGLAAVYMEQFERRKLDDNGVSVCIKYSDNGFLRKSLDQLIINQDHRDRFIEAFKNPQNICAISADQDVTCNVTVNVDDAGNVETRVLKQNEKQPDVQPRPVQIIETIKFQSGLGQSTTTSLTPQAMKELMDSARLKLHKQELKTILEKVGNRPVALLTIVGPSRQGKSFILNYMLQYLRSQSKQGKETGTADSDWMGKSESRRNEPLPDGFKWKSGMETQTEGIWMWSEPFTLTGKDGQEIDVLLVDTEGVFDSNSDKEHWETITGLSLLTSSCLVFNSINNIAEESLNTLKPFLEFGLMEKKLSDNLLDLNERPFQTLGFLIRDWGNVDDFSYGAKGGQGFLKSALDKKINSRAAKLRLQIKNSFKQLGCFLMPDPGNKVKRKAYNGSVAGMDDEFAKQVEIFVEQIFDRSTLAPKIVSGNIVTGDDLFLYFEQYAKLFSKYNAPTKEELQEVTTIINNQAVLKKSFALYQQEMKSVEERLVSSFFLENALVNKHENATHLAVNLFNKSIKMGAEDKEIKQVRKELNDLIARSFEKTTAMNLQRRNYHMEAAFKKLDSYSTKLIENEISSQSQGSDDFVTADTFDSIYNGCLRQARQMFLDTLGLTTLEVLPTKEQLRVEDAFAALKKSAELKNTVRYLEAENELQDLVRKLTENYESVMMDGISNFKYLSLDDFLKKDASCRYKCFKTLSNECLNSSFFSKGKQQLVDSIFDVFEKAKSIFDKENGSNQRL